MDVQLLREAQQLPRERLESLIPFTKSEWHLLFLTWQPEQWRPTRRSVDEELNFQQQTHEQLTRWGADLDGFIYLPSPVFGRRRSRAQCISAVVKRYMLVGSEAWLISHRTQNIEAGLMAGVNAIQIQSGEKTVAAAVVVPDFDAALETLPQSLKPNVK